MEKILIIDDDADIRVLLTRYLSKQGYDTADAANGETALSLLKKEKFNLVLCDFKLPDCDGVEMLQKIKILDADLPVIIITGYSDVKMAVKTIKLGAFEYVTKPLFPDEILVTIKNALRYKPDSNKKAYKSSNVTKPKFVDGVSPQAKQVLKHIELIAPTDMSVIIQGETGTGKEFVATAIHEKSTRKDQPFIAIDCGALPKELAGSELFGHIRGAFTGALNDKKGSFEEANGGTLFLDEVGNLSYENQIKLLRVLQERKIKKIGGNKEIPVDVRVIVATNEDLKKNVQSAKFREDLYHRFNEFKIEISPLRERKEDVAVFANYFFEQSNAELGKNVKQIDKEAMNKMKSYYWHGNLRELKNVVKRGVLLTQGDALTLDALPSEIINPNYLGNINISSDHEADPSNLKSISEMAERDAIVNVLEMTGYNKTKAAEVLNIDRKTLYNKLKNYNINLVRSHGE